MELNKFTKMMDTHNVAYINYTSTTGKRSFVVGTLDFDTPHIKKIEAANTEKFGSPRPKAKEGEVLIFSYSKDKFRCLPVDSIISVNSLAQELRKATPCSRKRSKA